MNYLNKKFLLILVFFLIRKELIGMFIPNTPCPNIFLYKYQKNSWYGELKILVPYRNTKIVNLEVKYYSRRCLNQEDVDRSPLRLIDTADEFAENIMNGIPVTFHLVFPFPNEPPSISNIILDDNIICIGPQVPEACTIFTVKRTIKVLETVKTIQVLNGIVDEKKQALQEMKYLPNTSVARPSQPQLQKNEIENRIFLPYGDETKNGKCGTESNQINAPVHLIVNGRAAEVQPWLVALFDNHPKHPTFFCAASLISIRFVVTAAHCVINKKEDSVLLKLGGKNAATLFESNVPVQISLKIILHPNYVDISSNADIAIIKMASPVIFNNNLKPICMWPNARLDEETIAGRHATIFGWGADETGHLTLSAPKKTNLIIKRYDECKKMDLLNSVISKNTICATGADSVSGPCLGDSGGGLYLNVNGKWTIRGIISAAISKMSSTTCDIENYFSVYTDTGKYFEWINHIVQTV